MKIKYTFYTVKRIKNGICKKANEIMNTDE